MDSDKGSNMLLIPPSLEVGGVLVVVGVTRTSVSTAAVVVVVLLESGTGLNRTSTAVVAGILGSGNGLDPTAVVAGILGSGNGLDTVVVGICRSALDLNRATGSPTYGLGTTSGRPDTPGIRDE